MQYDVILGEGWQGCRQGGQLWEVERGNGFHAMGEYARRRRVIKVADGLWLSGRGSG